MRTDRLDCGNGPVSSAAVAGVKAVIGISFGCLPATGHNWGMGGRRARAMARWAAAGKTCQRSSEISSKMSS